jgi:hypothetical protein
MKYQTYDEFLALVAKFRTEHSNLTGDELDKLIKKTFKINQATSVFRSKCLYLLWNP